MIALAALPLILGALCFLIIGIVRWKARARSSPDEPRVLRGMEVVSAAASSRNAKAGSTNAVVQTINVGGVDVPAMLESQHFLFAGTTGSGKTQGIDQILNVIRNRGSRAIVADAGGESLSRYFSPDDLLINPFDQRSVPWSPFTEIQDDYDCARIPRAAIPDVAGGLCAAPPHHAPPVLRTSPKIPYPAF